MINGLEEFTKKHKILEMDKLVHREVYAGAESNETSSNRSASHIFYSMVEQIVGQDLYKQLMDLQRSGTDFYKAVVAHQTNVHGYEQQVDATNEKVNEQHKEKADLEKKLADISKELMYAMEHNLIFGDKAGERDAIILRLKELKNEMTELAFNGQPTAPDNKGVENAKKALQDTHQKAQAQDVLKRAKEAVEKLRAEKETIIQGLVDGTLFPDMTEYEGTARQCAETMFNLALMEMDSLIKGVTLAGDLIDYSTKSGDYSASIPSKVRTEVQQIRTLNEVSSIITENSYELFTDKRFSGFVSEGIKQWKAKAPITEQSMFEIGKAQGVPANSHQAKKKKLLGIIPYGNPIELHLNQAPYTNVADAFVNLSELDKMSAKQNPSLTRSEHENFHETTSKVNTTKVVHREGYKKAGMASVVAGTVIANTVGTKSRAIETGLEEKLVARDALNEHGVEHATPVINGNEIILPGDDGKDEGMTN